MSVYQSITDYWSFYNNKWKVNYQRTSLYGLSTIRKCDWLAFSSIHTLPCFQYVVKCFDIVMLKKEIRGIINVPCYFLIYFGTNYRSALNILLRLKVTRHFCNRFYSRNNCNDIRLWPLAWSMKMMLNEVSETGEH